MGDLMEEMRALRRVKEQQNAALAAAHVGKLQEAVDRSRDDERDRSGGGEITNPLKVPASISGILVVNAAGGQMSDESQCFSSVLEVPMRVELRGPFLVWYSPEYDSVEEASNVTRFSIVGAAVEYDCGKVVIELGDKSVELEPKSGSGGDLWAEKLRRAARQDARRSEQAQAKKTSSSMASSNYTMADMERIELIGKGTYGEVWRTRVKATGREVALKMGSQKTELTREQCLLLDMDCPFVVRAEAIFSYEGAPCIIMPLLEGGDLDLHLGMTPEGYFSQERAMFHAAEILVGLDYLHSKGVVYRDLKPENVVLDAEGHTVLTDMGHARSLSATAYAETFCGTAEYLAPEILDANGHTHAVDHWALGVLLFEMICGTLPFSGPDIYGSILLKEPEFPDFVSPDARDLVSQLMRKQPAARPRSSQIRGHPFFSSLVWDNVEQRQYKPSFVPDLEVIRRLTRQQLRES